MAELRTDLPLQVEPVRIDLRAPMMDAANYQGRLLANEGVKLGNEGRRLDNELSGLSLAETQRKLGLMSDYRKAVEAGDEDALSVFKTDPAMQLEMRQTFDALEDSKLAEVYREASELRGLAERTVAADPTQQTEIWNRGLDDLKERGLLDEDDYAELTGNPNPAVLQQVILAGQTAETLTAERKAREVKAVEYAKAHPTSYNELDMAGKFDFQKQVNNLVEAVKPEYGFKTLKDQKQAYRQAWAQVERSFFGPGKGKGKGKGKGEAEAEVPDGKSVETAVTAPEGADEAALYDWFESLPVETIYLDPITGTPMQKMK